MALPVKYINTTGQNVYLVFDVATYTGAAPFTSTTNMAFYAVRIA
jgi:hypothetical protein